MWSFVESHPICYLSSSDPQEICEEDQLIIYISSHRYGEGFYRGSGIVTEIGSSKGEGY